LQLNGLNFRKSPDSGPQLDDLSKILNLEPIWVGHGWFWERMDGILIEKKTQINFDLYIRKRVRL
jgi:hypothetical protein